MAITVQCPNFECRANYSVDDSFLNRNVKCKRCGTRFVARPTLDERTSDTRPNARSEGETFSSFPADFGRYRVLRLLGRGGMGSVYLAEDSMLGRRVALKLPAFNAGESPQRAARFVREARSAAVLHHPNICTVFDAGEIAGRPFISMAFIEGKPLDECIDATPRMTERDAAQIARKIALALAHAHGKGIVHRDLKPANVMIAQDGEPIVSDFGLAKRISELDPAEEKLTKDGSVLGTPSYMAPEQVRGEIDRIGPATDLYSLGVILFEMLAGRAPYVGTMGMVMGQILAAPVPLVSEFQPGADPRLVEICRRAMSKDAADRFASMQELALAIDDYFGTPDRAAPQVDSLLESLADLEQQLPVMAHSSIAPRYRRQPAAKKWDWSNRRLLMVVAGSAFSILLLVAVGLAWNKNRGAPNKRGKQRAQANTASSSADMNPRALETNPGAGDSAQNTASISAAQAGTSENRPTTAQQGSTNATEASWISLFSGSSLDNWVNAKGGPARARLVDDYVEIIPGAGGLVTKQSFGPDYELETEFFIPIERGKTGQARGNSGIYLNGRYEIQILDSHGTGMNPINACGALYGRVGPAFEATRPAGVWQTLRIVFRAPLSSSPGVAAREGELTVVLNGAVVIDRAKFDKTVAGGLGTDLAARGPIMLQDHNSAVRFRNLRLRALNSPNASSASSALSSGSDGDYRPLFNGRDLAGWTPYGGPKWSWSSGRVVGTGNGAGFLLHEQPFEDFELQLEYRLAIGAGSGLFLRADPADDLSGAKQLEIQIIDDAYPKFSTQTADRLTGAVFGVFPRKVAPPIQRNDWNALRVRLEDYRIQVWVNGAQTVDANLDDVRNRLPDKPALFRNSGRIALQQNQQAAVEFRELKIKPLP